MGRRIEKNDLKFYTGFSSTLQNKIVNIIYIVILFTTWLMFLLHFRKQNCQNNYDYLTV